MYEIDCRVYHFLIYYSSRWLGQEADEVDPINVIEDTVRNVEDVDESESDMQAYGKLIEFYSSIN